MLVLTRKVGEGIAIGDDVKVVVMQIKGKQVRLGIKAGPSTVVHREEIYQRILEENRDAANSADKDLLTAADKIFRAPQVSSETPGQKRIPLRRTVRVTRDED